jgi:S-adenosyl methyltransferase
MASEWFRGIVPTRKKPPRIDTSVAHSARVYDYFLGGKDNFPADRDAGDRMIEALPLIVTACRENRAFLARAVRCLVSEAGIRQFLDIGTGIPTANNTHEVAQGLAPECRVVYADIDAIVLAHARALLTSTPEGATSFIDADLRDTPAILAEAHRVLDLSQPVALMLLMILHMVTDADDPHAAVSRILCALPAGSYLVVSHPPSDVLPEEVAKVSDRLNERMGGPKMTARSRAQVGRFFAGLELVEPGLVQVHEWRPPEVQTELDGSMWCAVGKKG